MVLTQSSIYSSQTVITNEIILLDASILTCKRQNVFKLEQIMTETIAAVSIWNSNYLFIMIECEIAAVFLKQSILPHLSFRKLVLLNLKSILYLTLEILVYDINQ